MSDLGFRPFDADNHYYESEDAKKQLILRDNVRELNERRPS